MKIHPAVLVENTSDLDKHLAAIAQFAPEIDIDEISWTRTLAKTLSIKEICVHLGPYPETFFTIDLMISTIEEDEFAAIVAAKNIKRVMLNFEFKQDLLGLLKLFQQQGKEIGISLNPETTIEDISEYLPMLDMVQIMTIEPGSQGNALLPKNMLKVAQLREAGFKHLIGADGHCNPKTLPQFIAAKFDIVSVGSAISKAVNPGGVYEEMNAEITNNK